MERFSILFSRSELFNEDSTMTILVDLEHQEASKYDMSDLRSRTHETLSRMESN